jgi:hypothetical protein
VYELLGIPSDIPPIYHGLLDPAVAFPRVAERVRLAMTYF